VLRELHITGLGVIDDVDLELHPGLNVLTGETGAGKTMVTVGLALALGQRASATLVRPGARAAKVQARFDATPAAEAAGWVEDGEIVLARTVSADVRSSARIGGQLAPVSALAELGEGLVEAHGQHQGLRLLSPATQTASLDRFAGGEHLSTLSEFADAHARWRALRSRLGELSTMTREREREIDLLRYQVREIETTALQIGELAELEAEESRLAHAERLLERAIAAETALAGDDAGADALGMAAVALGTAGELDLGAAELAAAAAALAAGTAELARDVREYREHLQLDPARLDEVRDRIGALRGLERKYGEGEAEVLNFLERARERLHELQGADDERERLVAGSADAEASVLALAAEVTAGRAAAAPGLSEALTAELRGLGMDSAEAAVTLAPLPELGSAGAERVEFAFSGGPGQPRLPLAKVASGGELSRTMLACRSVLVDLDDVPTLVFDEVDAGIGGRAAVAVGRRLAHLAEHRQVIVVTHLPQIASFADRHFGVRKHGGTATVELLNDAARVEELTRMLAGLPGSGSAAMHAEELLAEAGRAKTSG
jgi:DNA repair protein RecN (Recombination protein N)